MDTIKEIRRENLRKIAQEKGKNEALAKALNIDKSRVSHLIGKNAKKPISESVARKYEKLLCLPDKFLDQKNNLKESEMIITLDNINYNRLGLLKKYVDLAYGGRSSQNTTKFIIQEILDDQKKLILSEDISTMIKEIIFDETKLKITWEILHHLDFAKKIFSILNQH